MTTAQAEDAAATSEYPAGHTIAGKYVVETILGDGATSVVYVARRKAPGVAPNASPAAREHDFEDTEPPDEPSLVALKIIHRRLCEDHQIVGRFHREAAILKRLDGPHVLRVYEMIEHEGRLILVLEYVPSTPLDQRLAKGPPLDVKSAIEVALQVCAGLAAAHAAGVVHRDLKPANVLFSEDCGAILVKVADFGLAKLVHGDKMVTGLTEHDMIFGTPEYMAPEQARGDDVDARSDIYALGCMLYEMLTGDVPFRGHSPMVTMTAHLMHEVVPLRKKRADGAISAALEAVVMRALSKRPEDRHPSARALAEALIAAESSGRVIAVPGAADALGDTDLNLAAERSSSMHHSPTLPSGAPVSTRAPALATATTATSGLQADGAPKVSELTRRLDEGGWGAGRAGATRSPILDEDITLDRGPLTSKGGAVWVWVVAGVLAAVAAIAIGILAGTR